MDLSLIYWFNQLWSGTWIDKVSTLISWMPFVVSFWVIVIALLTWKFPAKRKKIIIAAIIGFVLFLLTNEFTFKKVLVNEIGIRPRPYVAHQDIIPLGTQYTDSSFPSSHMAWTLMVLTILIRAIPGSWVFALIFALLMGFSRIHNGMHYPSDVLTGWILWIAYWLIGIWCSKYIHRYYHKKK